MKYAGRITGGVLLTVFLFSVSHAAIIYVKSTSPYPTIQSGLDAASDGDIVLVGTGTYYENLIWPSTQGIQLVSEAGTYYTRIDGDTVGNVIQITSGVDSTTVINGFNIRYGYAASGSGIYCVNSSPTICNNLINYNESIDADGGGGGIYCDNSSPVIRGNHFAFNNAAGAGGDIFCESNSSPIIIDNTFFASVSFCGGSICLDASSPQIISNSFSTCHADSVGGGIYGRNGSSPTITENLMYNNYSLASHYCMGGAIIFDSNCVVTITKNTIHNNRADSAVGGILCYDGIIADNAITDNRADFGAGIGVWLYGTVTITGNIISNNTASMGGGGIVCGAYSTSMIRDNIISDNWGQYAGGGIVCDTSSTPTIRRNIITNNGSSSAVGTGAGIRCSDGAAPIIDSCTIANNDGEGIYCTDGAIPSIHYNEIEDNSDEGVKNDDAGVTIDAENNWWGDPSGPGGSGPGSGDEVSDHVDYDPWLTASISDSVPPATPYVLNAKAGSDAELTWNIITTDTLGNAESVDYYVIYRSSSPSFVPGPGDSIGAVSQPETTYTDVNALIAGSSYYYLVKAVDWKKNVSKKSNMAYVCHKIMNENPTATDVNWTSLPWHSTYAMVSDLTSDLSPSGDPLTEVTNLRDDQLYETYLWNNVLNMWLGTDFAIAQGRAYAMVTIADTAIVLVGSNDPDGLITLNENPATSDRNWVSIPYNAAYSTVSDITTEYAPAGNPLNKCTNLRDDQLYESYIWNATFNMWLGTDFAIEPCRGYELESITDTTWNPTEYTNEAEAAFMAQHEDHSPAVTVHVGSAVESNRTPAWQRAHGQWRIAQGKEHKADGVLPTASDGLERVGDNGLTSDTQSPMPSEASGVTGSASSIEGRTASHIVLVHVAMQQCDGLLFTAYRPDNPSDVLTNEHVGCGVVWDDEHGSVWFDVGNFKNPWHDGEELIVIIEAVKQGRGHGAVLGCALDARVGIQELYMVELVPIHEVQDNVIGYSLYRNGERLNDEILTQSAAEEDVTVRPVIRGGYETVYGSANVQVERREVPVAYAFAITPNPFSSQTRMTYAVPEPVTVDVVVFDITGRQVVELASGRRDPGYYNTVWYGTDTHGRQVAAGVYFVTCTAGDFTTQEKVLFVK